MWKILLLSFASLSLFSGMCMVIVTEWFYNPQRPAVWKFLGLSRRVFIILMTLAYLAGLACLIYVVANR